MPSRNRRFISEPYRLLSSIAAVLVGLSHSASAKSTRCPAPPVLTLGDCRIPQPGGPDIQSYGILIGVTDKTRATTHVCTMPSTLIPNMAFTEANLCSAADQRGAMSTAQCLSRRGGVLDVRNFDTVPLDRLLPRPGWTAFNPDFQFAIEAPLSLQSTRLTLPEALITGGPNLTTSYIGLSDESELLKALQDSGFIDSRSWMLDAGSRSASNPRSGTLILGGFDSSIVQGDFTTFPINYNKTAGSRYCPLQIIVESMNWRTGSDVRNLVDASTKATVCIDPYDTLFRFVNPPWRPFKPPCSTFRNVLPSTDAARVILTDPADSRETCCRLSRFPTRPPLDPRPQAAAHSPLRTRIS